VDRNFSKKSNEWKKALGRVIKNEIRELGTTNIALSKKTGVSPTCMAHIINGSNTLGPKVSNGQLPKIFEALSLSIENIELLVKPYLRSSNEREADLISALQDSVKMYDEEGTLDFARQHPGLLDVILRCKKNIPLDTLERFGLELFPFDGNTTADLLEAKEWFWGYYFERKSALSKKQSQNRE
jgi:hypothetical protein